MIGPDTPLSSTTHAELEEIVGRYPQARSALLPMLHLIQSAQGCVTNEGIEVCADMLGLSAAEVAGVATFYTMYKRRPVGDFHVGVCTNTLCAVMGGDAIFDRLQDHLGVGNDETTEDGKITLEHVECNAACDFAPVMMVNWEFFDNQTPESAVTTVDDLRTGKPVCATRGATISTWREAERVLAGFEDGRVDEGPAAGPASLVGLVIANDKGWSAPPVEREEDPNDDQSTAGGEQGSQPDSRSEAVDEANTSRAESETVVEEDVDDD